MAKGPCSSSGLRAGNTPIMANLVAIEPALFRADEAWFVFDDGRKCLRKINQPEPVARSNFPAPSIRRDSIAPCLGMDGKMHDSISSYRRTLKANGNPQGETYIELGNESLTPVKHEFCRKQRRDDIRAALADVKAGKPIAPPVTLED